MKRLLLALGFFLLVVSCGGSNPAPTSIFEIAVVGSCHETSQDQHMVPCYWTDTEGWVNMGIPWGGYAGISSGINDNGYITGWIESPTINGTDYDSAAFIWSKDSGYTHIEHPGGDPLNDEIDTFDITNNNRISFESNNGAGTWTDNGGVVFFTPTPSFDTAFAGSDNGTVVGWDDNTAGTFKVATEWKEVSGSWVSTGLGVLDTSHTESQAKSVNDNGLIVGLSGVSQGKYWWNVTSRFAWHIQPGGSMTAVPDCGNGINLWQTAMDVNNNDLVVGYIDDNNGDSFAYYWSPGDPQATCFHQDGVSRAVSDDGVILGDNNRNYREQDPITGQNADCWLADTAGTGPPTITQITAVPSGFFVNFCEDVGKLRN